MSEKTTKTKVTTSVSDENDFYMSRCLQLATYGAGYTAPNPMVGAVIVYDGQIIGEGFHRRFGDAHAEPNAINSVENKELLKSSTLYVSLEPCSHYGKTPPCADLIIRSGIPKVVVGTTDPNPKVSGRGITRMQEAGVEVVSGILEQECRELNKRFFIFQEQKRPYILLKWAQTSDGFIDKNRTENKNTPLAISNNITRQMTHKMRSENQSILVSTNTVLLDNPSLTVRFWSGKNPIRMAIDRRGLIPENFHLLDGSVPTLIFTENERLGFHNVEFIRTECDIQHLKSILQKIYEKNIHSVLVEGGAKLLNSFIQAGFWDEANVEISPNEIREGVPAPELPVRPVRADYYNDHQWLFYKNRHPFSDTSNR